MFCLLLNNFVKNIEGEDFNINYKRILLIVGFLTFSGLNAKGVYADNLKSAIPALPNDYQGC